MAPVRAAVDAVLRAHAPHPALAVDRHWDLVSANAGVDLLTRGVAAHLLDPPVNVLRDRKSTRLNSSHANISYAVFCLKKTSTSSSPLPSLCPLPLLLFFP